MPCAKWASQRARQGPTKIIASLLTYSTHLMRLSIIKNTKGKNKGKHIQLYPLCHCPTSNSSDEQDVRTLTMGADRKFPESFTNRSTEYILSRGLNEGAGQRE